MALPLVHAWSAHRSARPGNSTARRPNLLATRPHHVTAFHGSQLPEAHQPQTPGALKHAILPYSATAPVMRPRHTSPARRPLPFNDAILTRAHQPPAGEPCTTAASSPRSPVANCRRKGLAHRTSPTLAPTLQPLDHPTRRPDQRPSSCPPTSMPGTAPLAAPRPQKPPQPPICSARPVP
jgi:hypothetical protein